MHGKWFCSPACAERDPETLRIRAMLERKERGEIEEEDEEEFGESQGEVDL
jgi:hypothetical protein